VTSDADFEAWLKEHKQWATETAHWIDNHLSRVDAQRFGTPVVRSFPAEGNYNEKHAHVRATIDVRLDELNRLLAGEREALR
jgi:hypothetical protein